VDLLAPEAGAAEARAGAKAEAEAEAERLPPASQGRRALEIGDDSRTRNSTVSSIRGAAERYAAPPTRPHRSGVDAEVTVG